MTVFVDTNVLVYAHDASEGDKQVRATRWLDYLWKSKLGCLSEQILHEFYVTVTRKLSLGLNQVRAREEVNSLMAWRPSVSQHGELIKQAYGVEDRYGLNYWDALIVAAAESAGCRYLLTEDLQHNQQLGSVLVINPFLVDPESI